MLDRSIERVVFPEWERSKLESYREPTRRGVSKGSPIGLSYAKYRCALNMVFTKYKSPKEASNLINKSPLLVAKWKTESFFRSEVKRFSIEFAEYVAKLLIKKRGRELASLEVLEEFHQYNKDVRAQIIRALDLEVRITKKKLRGRNRANHVKSHIFLDNLKWVLSSRDKLCEAENLELFRELIKMKVGMLNEMHEYYREGLFDYPQRSEEAEIWLRALEVTIDFLREYLQ